MGAGGRSAARRAGALGATLAGTLAAAAAAGPSPAAAHGPTLDLRSRPDLHPPALTVTSDADSRSGDFFLTVGSAHVNGLMILNAQGKLLWFRPIHHGGGENLQVQTYRGHHVLTWWQGHLTPEGASAGKDMIMSRSYRTLAVVRAGNGYSADLHEFQITPQGTALLDAQTVRAADLRTVGGPTSGSVLDCIIQEVDIPTERVLWEWHASDHVPVSATEAGPPRPGVPYDFFHLNSIQQLPNGNLLISSRNTWAVYEISRRTGRVIWTLGGKHSSFAMGPGTNFEWQHDARMGPGGRLTLFNDAALPQEERQSSATVLRVNLRAKTVSLVHRYTHSPALLTSAGGSTQTLPNHDLVVGWGSQPYLSEYTPTGRQIFDVGMPLGFNSYRVVRFPWQGMPLNRPVVAVTRPKTGGLSVFVSWSGATRVAAWRVLGGPSSDQLRPRRTVAWRDFETRAHLPGRPAYVAVQALDGHDRLLRSSSVVSTSSGG
ncbi:MAG: arylsulfotransferase family protein [Solirubrobacteraceae bacterium]